MRNLLPLWNVESTMESTGMLHRSLDPILPAFLKASRPTASSVIPTALRLRPGILMVFDTTTFGVLGDLSSAGETNDSATG